MVTGSGDWDLDIFVGSFTKLYPTLCDPIDCSLPGSSVHGIFQARFLVGLASLFSSRSSPTQGLNLYLLLGRWILYH